MNASVETVVINKFKDFDDLQERYNEANKRRDWKPSMIVSSGFGDKRMVGVASCGQDDGDVEVHAVFDTEEERERVLNAINEAVDKVNKENEDTTVPMGEGEFYGEYVDYAFDTFYFSASLWG